MKRLAESHKAKLPDLKTMKVISSASILLLIILFSSVILVPSVVATSSSNDDWPTFQHDASHSGSSTSKAPLTNQTLWTFTTGDKVESSPVVANGAVYVGSDDGYFYALNAYNGSLLWRYNTYGPIQSAATVVDGVVYFGGFHSHAVFALNASTGELIWNSPTTSIYPNKISSTAVANGLVYVEINNDGFGGELRALNASTGSLVWKYDPSSWLSTSPALYGDKIYIGSSDQIAALDANSGGVDWNYLVMRTGPSANRGDGAYSGYSSLTVSDGLLYIGTAVQTIQAWNASTGELVWIGNIKGAVYFSTIAVDNGVIYASTSWGGIEGTLQPPGVTALNAKSGAFLWNTSLGSIMYSSPAIANNVVVVGSDSTGYPPDQSLPELVYGHIIYALKAETGSIIWSYITGGEVYSSPVVAYGLVYVGSNDGRVYAFGSPPETSPASSPTPAVPEFSFQMLILVIVISAVFAATIVRLKQLDKWLPAAEEFGEIEKKRNGSFSVGVSESNSKCYF